MTGCQEAIYSEDYEDYIIEYAGQEQDVAAFAQAECYQALGMGFGVVYQRVDRVVPELREAPWITPRCFGLLSSEQVLEEAGIVRARSQPRLELFGRGVLFGIIDTGAGVRKKQKEGQGHGGEIF